MTSKTTDLSESGLLEGLTSHWETVKGTGWRAWLRYLVPQTESEDPRFRKTLTRLSIIGLRAIAGVCLVGTVIWLVLGTFFIPGSLSRFGAAALVAFSLVGLVTFLFSFWPPAQSRARFLGLTVLAVLPMLDLLGSMSISITLGERWAFLVASIILMMLIAIAALPVRPLQMTAFGTLFIGMFTTARIVLPSPTHGGALGGR